jgi:hypothetical protein
MRDHRHAMPGALDVERTTQGVPASANPRAMNADSNLPANLAPVLRFQATAGNAAVLGLLHGRAAPSIQRLWDTDDESEDWGTDEETAGGATSAEDDVIEEPDAAGDAVDAVQADVENQLDPDTVVDTLAPYAAGDGQMGDFEVPDTTVTAQALFLQRDPPASEPAPTKPGSPGDVIKALMPYLKPALDFLKANVLEALSKIKAGEAVVTVIVAAPIIIGPLTQPGPRRLALDQLDGTDVTFGVIPNLQLKPQITDGQLRGGTLTYDLAPALRKAGIPF